MREINGFKVRGLTRKEIAEFKEFGFYSSMYSPPLRSVPGVGFQIDAKKADEGVQKVLERCVKDYDQIPEDLGNADYLDLFRKGIMPETYGSDGEEKNSEASGPGPQTQNE